MLSQIMVRVLQLFLFLQQNQLGRIDVRDMQINYPVQKVETHETNWKHDATVFVYVAWCNSTNLIRIDWNELSNLVIFINSVNLLLMMMMNESMMMYWLILMNNARARHTLLSLRKSLLNQNVLLLLQLTSLRWLHC